MLRDESTGCLWTTDETLASKGFAPMSSFKIANALISLETGVIQGEGHVFRWDGSPRLMKAWEQDLDLAGALQVSCVPCFQQVARQVGRARMQRYLQSFGYGNKDISGPIERFWLTGKLRITPRGQVEFLHRMLSGKLQVERSNVKTVWRSLELESGPGVILRGKTGLGVQGGRVIGWLVGYVEREGHRWIYATLVLGRTNAPTKVKAEMKRVSPVRKPITLEMLARAGIRLP